MKYLLLRQRPMKFIALKQFLIALIAGFASNASAATFTVGPGGSHSDLGDALAAASAPGNDEIRIAAGLVLNNPPYTFVTSSSGDLTVSGGWSADFAQVVASAQQNDATAINGNNTPAPIRVAGNSGVLRVSRIVIFNGNGTGTSEPSALRVESSQNAIVMIDSLWVRDSSGADGNSCARLTARNDSSIQLQDFKISNCQSTGLNVALPSAMTMQALEASSISLVRGVLEQNFHSAPNTSSGSTIGVNARDSAIIQLDQIELSQNQSSATTVFGSAIAVESAENSRVRLMRMNIHDNIAPNAPPNTAQLALSATSNSEVTLQNSLIYSGPQTGLAYTVQDAARLRMSNINLVAHAQRGLIAFVDPGALQVTLHNSIVSHNGVASTAPAGTNNLGANIGLVEPIFIASAPTLALDFRLRDDSPGINAGTLATPTPAGNLDFIGNARISANLIDIGAFEQIGNLMFSSGFE